MAIKQEVNTAIILTVGAVSGLLLIVIIVGLQAWFMFEERVEIQEKWAKARNVQLETTLNAQRERISGHGPTTMPAEEAMRVLAQQGGKVKFAQESTTQPKKQ
jgi:hypothetical protein